MATLQQVTPVAETTYKELLDRLEYLAGLWRHTKEDQVVQRYQIVLATLLELGYREWLDLEAMLPDRLMPPEYTELMLTAEAEKDQN
jgi:hypothetical protein